MALLPKLFGRKKNSNDDFLSIVFLLRRPRRVDDPRLQASLARLIQRMFELEQPPATHIKQINEQAHGLGIEGQPFVIMAMEEPYTSGDPAELTPDLRKQNLLREHKAWLACDWMLPVSNDAERALAYRTMGMMMAAVAAAGAKEDAIAVFDKATGRLSPFNDG